MKIELLSHITYLMSFNLSPRGESQKIKPATKIYREQIIHGYAVPAFIHNMNYYFVDLNIYENGRVDCWNFKDFDHFIEDVKRGWVMTQIPDGKDISIFGLCRMRITDGDWLFGKQEFITYIQSLIRDLNPNWENIYEYSEKKINGVTIGEDGKGIIYKERNRVPNDIFPKKLRGDSVNLFYKEGNDFYLIKVVAFEDDTLQLSRLEAPLEIRLTDLEQLIHNKVISTNVPAGSTVQIHGLGKFTAQESFFNTDIEEKLLEIKDLLRTLKGEPSTIQLCRQAYDNYLNNPTIEAKEHLRATYESIPKHKRIFVGDMDTKDWEVRKIIYGEEDSEH